MKEELKEILEEMVYFKYHYKEFKNVEVTLEYDGEQITQIYDYITNLQEQLHQASLDIQELKEKDKKIKYLESELIYKKQVIKDLQKNNELKKNQRYYKNGVFSLEYDKETMSDIIDDYKSRNEKAIENIDLVIELIKQQPTKDDTWILNRLNGFKYLLKGDKDE